MSEVKKIIWTKCKESAKDNFNFYKEKSLQGANKIKEDIFKVTNSIRFTE